jgi:hypothetical protein
VIDLEQDTMKSVDQAGQKAIQATKKRNEVSVEELVEPINWKNAIRSKPSKELEAIMATIEEIIQEYR